VSLIKTKINFSSAFANRGREFCKKIDCPFNNMAYLKVLYYSRIQSPKESIGRGVWYLSFE